MSRSDIPIAPIIFFFFSPLLLPSDLSDYLSPVTDTISATYYLGFRLIHLVIIALLAIFSYALPQFPWEVCKSTMGIKSRTKLVFPFVCDSFVTIARTT